MQNKYKAFETASDLINTIPRTVKENVEWRIDFHKMVAKDKSLQKVFWKFCREDLQVLFDSTFWTLDPRKGWGLQNQPFILRPQQIPAVHKINKNIIDSQNSIVPKDVGINKTRDEGASEIVAKIFSAWTMLYERVSFILGSDKKEDVDNQGNDFTLFAKVDNVFQNLPSWMGFKYKDDGGCVKRKDMLLRVERNNSAIIGETTNENFSAGSRATAMVLDEFGRIRKSVAESIEGTVHAVTNWVIYSSTHWLGQNHTFNICLNKKTTDVIELLWHQNPQKAEGLYKSPKVGQIQLLDVAYYERNYPGLFKYVDKNNTFEKENVPKSVANKIDKMFVADGMRDKIVACRSPWHDYKEEQSKGNKRDFYCNTWATPLGSSDTVFDPVILYQIQEKNVRNPEYRGEISFRLNENDAMEDVKFYPEVGQRRFSWWTYLIECRPDQRHNYIIGIDIGQGLGSSNSVAYIYDVNTHEIVGEWVDSNTKPEAFADMCIALAKWCGGVDPSFLIWEGNGGQGTVFASRIKYMEYYHCYQQTVEDAKQRKRKEKYGFFSNTDRKAALLLEFGIALDYALEDNRRYVAAFIYSAELVNELFDYIFVGGTKEITTSSKADLSSGARERHGDRAIAASLCILGTRDQLPGDWSDSKEPPHGSFEYYRRIEEQSQAKDKRLGKKYLY